jgi:hypothetical protein
MGLGEFLTESVVHDPATGVLLSAGTFEYKPPTSLDIPIKMKVLAVVSIRHGGSRPLVDPSAPPPTPTPMLFTPHYCLGGKRAVIDTAPRTLPFGSHLLTWAPYPLSTPLPFPTLPLPTLPFLSTLSPRVRPVAQTTFLPDHPNPAGVLGSKATGEPSFALATSALLAVKHAVRSARADAGASRTWAP